MDINKMFKNTFNELVNSGKVEEIMKKHIEKCIESIFGDVFNGYSDFSKDIKNKITESLKLNLDSSSGFTIPEYNQLVINMVKAEVDKHITNESQKELADKISKLLVGEDKEITLSGLIEELKDERKSWDDNPPEKISFHYEGDSLIFIYFDDDAGKDKYKCAYRITVRKDGTIHSFEEDDHSYKSAHGLVHLGAVNSISRTLFHLYSSKKPITLDFDEVDTKYRSDDYDD